nr:hypothetical protein [uncultured archaeon]AQS34134.1 hypothetical protein [uncultured archaeon]
MQDIVWRRQHYHNQRVRLIEAITDSNFVEIDIYHIRNSAVRVTTPRRLSEAKYEIFVGDDSVQDIERDFIYLVNEAIHRIMIQENK